MRQRIVGLLGGKRRRRFLFGAVAPMAVLGALARLQRPRGPRRDVPARRRRQREHHDQYRWQHSDARLGQLLQRKRGREGSRCPRASRASGFDKDFPTNANGSFNTTDHTTFATGSKDTLPITPGWQCNRDAQRQQQDRHHERLRGGVHRRRRRPDPLLRAWSATPTPATRNVGFWFLQDENVDCSSPGGNTPFTGDHRDGDLLVVSAFTNGGTVSTIDVYRWNGGANGSLGTTPVAHGVDCKTTAGNTDPACATVNGPTNGTGGTITTPWLTANKQDGPGHSLRTSEFFEGGLEPHRERPRRQVLQHVPRRHPLFAVPDRDAVRLRARRARRVHLEDHDDARRQRRRHDPSRRA